MNQTILLLPDLRPSFLWECSKRTHMQEETFFYSDAQIFFEDHFGIVFIPLVVHIP